MSNTHTNYRQENEDFNTFMFNFIQYLYVSVCRTTPVTVHVLCSAQYEVCINRRLRTCSDRVKHSLPG
jgi:multisubunit Na+/H+ antiporter MnhG subunit